MTKGEGAESHIYPEEAGPALAGVGHGVPAGFKSRPRQLAGRLPVVWRGGGGESGGVGSTGAGFVLHLRSDKVDSLF